jgi:hypothetical protein
MYEVTFGGVAVAVNNGIFTAERAGEYAVRVKASDTAGNESAWTEFVITAAKKGENPPVVTVPTGFKTEYGIEGQVKLDSITAKDSFGTDCTVTFSVKGPNGDAVAVEGNRFTFAGGAGEYEITVTALDADGNTAESKITVNAVGGGSSGGCGNAAAAIGLLGMFAAVLFVKKRK